MEEIYENFANLFAGSDKAFGRCIIRPDSEDKPKYWYERRPVGESDWKAHFSGEFQIGMPPIRSDNKVRWGAIDVSAKKLDIDKKLSEIKKLPFPLIACISKSGGLHLFLFLKEWVPAADMIKVMDWTASRLAFGASEIFPKQAKIIEGQSDFGNFINLPYYREGQHAVTLDNEPFSEIKDFLEYAGDRQVEWSEILAADLDGQFNETLRDGPPCLNILYETQSYKNARHVVLFNTAVYLKRKSPDSSDWERDIEVYNNQLEHPLERSDVRSIVKEANKNGFSFQCSQSCMNKYCNSSLCRTRRFGIGDKSFMSNNRSLTKFASMPPLWFLDVKVQEEDPVRISLITDELQSQRLFQKKCMEAMNILPSTLKNADWEDQVQQLLKHATVIDLPDDSTLKDEFEELLEVFFERRAQVPTEDDIHRDLPYKSATHFMFKRTSLERFLKDKQFKELRSNVITAMLHDIGATACNSRIGKKRIRYWELAVNWNGGEAIQTSLDIKDEENPF